MKFYFLFYATAFKNVLLTILTFALLANVSFSEDTMDKASVISVANQAWQQYAEQMKQLRFEGKTTNTFRYAPYRGPNKLKDEEVVNSEYHFIYDSYEWCSEDCPEEDVDKRVYCYNVDYYFSLSSNDSSDLLIQDVRQWKNKNPLKNKIAPASFSDMRYEDNAIIAQFLSTCTGLYVSSAYLPLLIKQAGFEVKDVRKEENDRHEERVVLVFSYDPEKGESFPILSGELTLMPDKYWLIEEAKCILWSENGNELKTWKNEYKDVDIGQGKQFPVFVKQTFSMSDQPENGNLKVSGEIVHTIELLDKSPDKSRFRLTHYGFPEPIFDNSKGDVTRFVLFIVGGGAVLLAMWIMIVRKRREESK